jgi:hypothetical protein
MSNKKAPKIDKSQVITLEAIFQSGRTTIDGGIRISFDLDSSQADVLSKLLKLAYQRLAVAISPIEENNEPYPYLNDL